MTTLTPVRVTRRLPGFRSGRLEAWEAASDDGQWVYVREDTPGTPWAVEHVPSARVVATVGSLRKARKLTASMDAVLVPAEPVARFNRQAVTP
jgi:hypothetical protein